MVKKNVLGKGNKVKVNMNPDWFLIENTWYHCVKIFVSDGKWQTYVNGKFQRANYVLTQDEIEKMYKSST